ncbi:phosphoribosyltransferase [Paractinoplanes brasiliensis]|uniref:phosphoribosyltransferase n=1 Tax=Paractinoplanes brasiliensis TaxID=52695 RepID=UPI001EF2F157|nr:phosphoribosyltransferase family protein [Actinoplanes brasiliensis]
MPDHDTVVLGLPRGGVPVAAEVAAKLHAPLDVIIVRKVGVPWQPELAMGAVGEAGTSVVNRGVVRRTGVKPDELGAAQAHARVEVQRRLQALRGDRAPVRLAGRTAIVVDDGIATGSTARAACRVARALGAARVVLASPVGSPDAVTGLADVADEVICLERPAGFGAVGQYYKDFRPTTDHEVLVLMNHAADRTLRRRLAVDREVEVPDGAVEGGRIWPATGSARSGPRHC